jgi:hypothetical protein
MAHCALVADIVRPCPSGAGRQPGAGVELSHRWQAVARVDVFLDWLPSMIDRKVSVRDKREKG